MEGCRIIRMAVSRRASGIFLLFAIAGNAQTPPAIEITRKDFTKETKIVSTKLRVFGIGLGDSLADAKVKAERAGLKLTSTEGRYSVFSGDDELIGVDFEGDKVVKLALFSEMATYLAGDSAPLFGSILVLAAHYNCPLNGAPPYSPSPVSLFTCAPPCTLGQAIFTTQLREDGEAQPGPRREKWGGQRCADANSPSTAWGVYGQRCKKSVWGKCSHGHGHPSDQRN